jgi:drug/metabolite transporter (DMT)-like permease
MLVSFSVMIPLIWGITVGNETLKVIQYPALALLLGAIVLTNVDKIRARREKDTETRYGIWLLFVGITFGCNGVCSILQKQHQTLYSEAYSGEFMLFAMLLCAIVFSLAAIGKVSLKEWRAAKGKHLGMLSGLANGIANFLTLILAGMENASVLFPIISAGTNLGSLACGSLLFREKLKANHFVALAAGVVAVVLLKL